MFAFLPFGSSKDQRPDLSSHGSGNVNISQFGIHTVVNNLDAGDLPRKKLTAILREIPERKHRIKFLEGYFGVRLA